MLWLSSISLLLALFMPHLAALYLFPLQYEIVSSLQQCLFICICSIMCTSCLRDTDCSGIYKRYLQILSLLDVPELNCQMVNNVCGKYANCEWQRSPGD